MNLKVEHGIIAILLLAFLYYFYKHQSLLSDLLSVPNKGNPLLEASGHKKFSFRRMITGKCPPEGCTW